MGMVVAIALMWFIIEMLLWYLIGRSFNGGGWAVFIWFGVAAVLGIAMIKKTATTLSPMAQQMKSGVIPNPLNQPPETTLTKAIITGVAGLLLLLPGILSDIVAVAFLIPFVQSKLVTKAKNYAMNNQDKMMAMMAKQMGGTGSPFGGMGGKSPFGTQNPFGGNSPFGTNSRYSEGRTIDGTAKVTTNTNPTKSANDDT